MLLLKSELEVILAWIRKWNSISSLSLLFVSNGFIFTDLWFLTWWCASKDLKLLSVIGWLDQSFLITFRKLCFGSPWAVSWLHHLLFNTDPTLQIILPWHSWRTTSCSKIVRIWVAFGLWRKKALDTLEQMQKKKGNKDDQGNDKT